MKRIYVFAMTLLLAACADKPLSVQQAASMNEYSVVSLIDDSIPIDYKGFMRHNNKDVALNISDWNLPEFISKSFQEMLPDKKFVALSLNQNELNKVRFEKQGLMANRSPGQDFVLKAAETSNIPYVWMVHPIQFLPEGDMMNRGRGLAAYCPTASLTKNQLLLYAQFNVSLWEVKTKKALFNYLASSNNGFGASSAYFGKTDMACNEKKMDEDIKQLTSFKDRYLKMLTDAIQTSLAKSGLTASSK